MRATGISRLATVWLALVVPVLVLRIVGVVDGPESLSAHDARGALSDAGVAWIAAAVVALLARLSRALAVVVAIAWTLIHYASYETVLALDSLAAYRDAHFLTSATFWSGSVSALRRPLLLAVLVLFSGSLAGGSASGSRLVGVASTAFGAAAGALILAALAAWPPSSDGAAWRQINVVDYNARLAASDWMESGRRSGATGNVSAVVQASPGLAADLNGESWLPDHRARNVLLIVVESAAGAYLPSSASRQGVSAEIQMPALEALAARNVRLDSFVLNQTKTNRGLYALLCGDLPNLGAGLPKMTAYAMQGGRRCLPEVLRDAGYQTLYAQAASLGFMNKGAFMPRAGFDRVIGDSAFESAYMRTRWGVDDRAFYEQVVPEIARLAEETRPWFATTLNVGTHHPFVVPGLEAGETGRAAAVAYADAAVAAFLDALGERGLLDDTLVLITTDEASGIASEDAVVRRLSKQWGIFVAIVPGVAPLAISEPFSQMDVSLSIVDYLQVADRAEHFLGRSLFRRYSRNRPIFFAHSSSAVTGSLEAGLLFVCQIWSCQSYATPLGAPFGPARRPIAFDPERRTRLRELRLRSAAEPIPRGTPIQIAEGIVALHGDVPALVSGGQYLSFGADEWIEVTLEVSARGDGDHVRLEHGIREDDPAFADGHPVRYATQERLRDGETLRLRYTVAPVRGASALEARTSVRAPGGGRWEIAFRVAEMRVRSGDGRPREEIELLSHSTDAAKPNEPGR